MGGMYPQKLFRRFFVSVPPSLSLPRANALITFVPLLTYSSGTRRENRCNFRSTEINKLRYQNELHRERRHWNLIEFD